MSDAVGVERSLYSQACPAVMRRVPEQVVLWSLVGMAALLLGYGVWVFNRLILLRNRLREAWSGVDVQLKRRHSQSGGEREAHHS